MQNHAHAFTASYMDGTVCLAGKRFPAGYFVVEALNAWAEIDLTEQSGAWEQLLLSALQSGHVAEMLFCEGKGRCVCSLGEDLQRDALFPIV